MRSRYDADGNETQLKDPAGNITGYVYNPDNERTQTNRADTTTVKTGYDGDGNVTSQTNGNNQATTYTYTPLNEVSKITDPLNRVTSYNYDLAGRLTSILDPQSRTTTYGYDTANRLTSITYSDGVTPNVSYTYYPNGQHKTMTDGTGTTSWTYDSLDRLTADTNGAGAVVKYSYDLAGNVTSITYPGSASQVVTYKYNNAEQETSVSDWLGHTTSFNYDQDSNITSMVLPTSITDTSTFDHADNLLSTGVATTGSPQNPYATFTYTYNPDNLIATEVDTGEPSPQSNTYTYNPLLQITSTGNTTFAYDNAGNVTKFNGTSGYTYDNASELTANPGRTYTYSPLGQRTASTPTSGTATNYSYNQAGELNKVAAGTSTTATYAYDGTGLRTSETAGATTYKYTYNTVASIPLILTDSQNSYIYGPASTPIEQISSGGTAVYLHHDALGSVRRIGNQAGTVVGSTTYTPYGTLAGSTGTTTSPFGYAGAYTDPATGLLYLDNRYYDPTSGQFITSDPLLPATGQPYSYANDNPANWTDPTGLGCGILDPGGCINDVAGAIASGASATAGFVAQNWRPIVGGVADLATAGTCIATVGAGCSIAIGLNVAAQSALVATGSGSVGHKLALIGVNVLFAGGGLVVAQAGSYFGELEALEAETGVPSGVPWWAEPYVTATGAAPYVGATAVQLGNTLWIFC